MHLFFLFFTSLNPVSKVSYFLINIKKLLNSLNVSVERSKMAINKRGYWIVSENLRAYPVGVHYFSQLGHGQRATTVTYT